MGRGETAWLVVDSEELQRGVDWNGGGQQSSLAALTLPLMSEAVLRWSFKGTPMLIWLVAWPSIAQSGTCEHYDEARFIIDTKELDSTESSGLAAARTRPGVFFTHDDSGAGPQLFSFSLDGSLAEAHDVSGAMQLIGKTLPLHLPHRYSA